jgi:hypothetical protein
MNNDLISRSALKEEIVKLCEHINANNGITVPTLAFTRIIDNAPTVEEPYKDLYIDLGYEQGYERGKNERPHGKWICNPTYCYKCNQTNCGADMRKEADNESKS